MLKLLQYPNLSTNHRKMMEEVLKITKETSVTVPGSSGANNTSIIPPPRNSKAVAKCSLQSLIGNMQFDTADVRIVFVLSIER
jgi:hypothetical protein